MKHLNAYELRDKLEKAISEREVMSARLLNLDRWAHHINIYYSCWGAVFSVWSLINNKIQIAFTSVIFSIVLVVLITYVDSQRLTARAKDIDANLLDMRNLLTEINGSASDEESKLMEWDTKYNSYLAASESPGDIDKNYDQYRKPLRLLLFFLILVPFVPLAICLTIINEGWTLII